jgi:hypothetical protein
VRFTVTLEFGCNSSDKWLYSLRPEKSRAVMEMWMDRLISSWSKLIEAAVRASLLAMSPAELYNLHFIHARRHDLTAPA